jgi:hypothetical protein
VASSHERSGKLATEWLLIEWPEGEDEPTKYWLSTLSSNITFRDLVDAAKLRWRIERDYQELKQEVGLGHYEGRGWRGFHHHATLCIAAYGFLISERETVPPSGPRSAALLPQPTLPHSYRPRGSPPCGLNGTSQTRSPPCAEGSSLPSLVAYHAARAAGSCSRVMLAWEFVTQ